MDMVPARYMFVAMGALKGGGASNPMGSLKFLRSYLTGN